MSLEAAGGYCGRRGSKPRWPWSAPGGVPPRSRCRRSRCTRVAAADAELIAITSGLSAAPGLHNLRIDLARARSARLGIIGLGNIGAAVLAQLAPLPWRSVLLIDRDVLEGHNLPAHALAAETPGFTSDAQAKVRPSQAGANGE